MRELSGLDTTALAELERKALWLATWTIHNANHLRPSEDGLKVGGHQASSASIATIMTALYLHVLRPEDRVAVKPHASPVFHAIQYLLGNQTLDKLQRFRGFGGAQSYPSRTKDTDDVDFSTGSVGLGVAQTLFSSLVQDYLHLKGWGHGRPEGKMVALIGDAEMDEGNIFEALLEGWKHGLRNTWWVVDYNRQSLDAVVREGLWAKFESMFRNFGWDVVVLRHGRLQEAAFQEPGGARLREWIEACPNQLYSALTFAGGAAWRRRLLDELGDQGDVSAMVERRSDDELAALMGNLGGHDLPSLLQAFEAAREHDRPVCFICYTIKGFGLPLAGHKDNHAGLMNPAQVEALRTAMAVRPGHEWEKFEGLATPLERLQAFLDAVPFNAQGRRRFEAPAIPVPDALPVPTGREMSTQHGFGMLMHDLAKGDTELAARIVTTSPDVTVSTNLGAWVNRRGLFAREELADTFKTERIPSTFHWRFSPQGQHMELGIAEMNLFTMLSALGLSHALHGERLLPIGTLYDPFIERGLDALNYACYQDARFILVATPSGISLAGEGGAHQSIATPLIGMAQDGLSSFEPAYVDELATILRWALEHIQRPRPRTGSGRRGVSPAIDPQPRPAAAAVVARGCRRDRRRRLLGAAPRPERRGRHRLYRHRGAGSGRSRGPDRRGPPRRGPAGRDLGRPAAQRLADSPACPRGRAHGCRQPRRTSARRGAAPLRPGHRARRPPGNAGLARLRARPPHARARRHPVRANRHDRRSLPGSGHRRAGHHRRGASRGARAAHAVLTGGLNELGGGPGQTPPRQRIL